MLFEIYRNQLGELDISYVIWSQRTHRICVPYLVLVNACNDSDKWNPWTFYDKALSSPAKYFDHQPVITRP